MKIVETEPQNYIDECLRNQNFSFADSKSFPVSYPYVQVKNESQNYNPSDFRERVEKWNADRLLKLMKLLNNHLKNLNQNSIAVLVVGSDARREKGPYSPIEFIVLSNDLKTATLVVLALKKLPCEKQFCTNNNCDGTSCVAFDKENIEVKVVNENTILSGYYGNKHHIWPDRILSSQLVYGSLNMLHGARKQVTSEITSNLKIQKIFLNNGKKFKSNLIVNNTHFNLDSGSMYLNPSEYQGGTKYGPIRFLQFALTRYQIYTNQIFVDPHTHNRISQLNSNISNESLSAVSEAYYFCLLQYHKLQLAYSELNNEKPNMSTNKSIKAYTDPEQLITSCQTILKAAASFEK